ncbi:MAG: branched-chain amino acid aminotransferase [Ignavibacteriales bacterium]|nr:branched-chain amino acid aminotransferase [Ignavibacteriales bacterium]
MQIKIETTKNSKPKPDQSNLGFGKYFTDHMFIADYSEEKGWHDARIIPYQPLSLDPATSVFHYGQAIFEGMKAYLTAEGRILLFRPRKNMERINNSDDRMCMPLIDVDFGVEAIKTLVRVDRDWIPTADGTSLYIRPFIISTDPFLGVKASGSYKFIIILSPVGAYYPQGIAPVKIYVEPEYVRAVRGGTGYAKAAGNYAGSMKAQSIAAKKGYVQVLWLDGVEKKYIEEVGAMNVFFKLKGEIVTPALEGSILPGVTRESVIFLLKHWGMRVSERRISIHELNEAFTKGELEEAFGTGTAAVISPIGELNWNGSKMILNNGMTGEIAHKLYETLTGIQFGRVKDEFGWTVEV